MANGVKILQPSRLDPDWEDRSSGEEASTDLFIVCWNMNFIPPLRINRIRNLMLFGKEERWLVERERSLLFIHAVSSPGTFTVHTHRRARRIRGKKMS